MCAQSELSPLTSVATCCPRLRYTLAISSSFSARASSQQCIYAQNIIIQYQTRGYSLECAPSSNLSSVLLDFSFLLCLSLGYLKHAEIRIFFINLMKIRILWDTLTHFLTIMMGHREPFPDIPEFNLGQCVPINEI